MRVPQRSQVRAARVLKSEAAKEDGLFLRVGGKYFLRYRIERRLRKRVRGELSTFQQVIAEHEAKGNDIKTLLRQLHQPACAEKYQRASKLIGARENELLEEFADGSEISVKEFWPRLEVVENESHSNDLFKYASLLWSVPVSGGFGRRVRFIVRDESNDRIVGLFALGDPVFNLTARDNWVGWTHLDRASRLYNVMDLFVVGAVPPYNTLLGGKLVAMLAASNEVQGIISSRYQGTKTVIQKKRKDSRLALLTTCSALGRSSLYDRIDYQHKRLFLRIGESQGWGHFHLNHGLFEDLRGYIEGTVPSKVKNRFGDGPNWRLRTARTALDHLGFPGKLLQHGIRREVYAIPLAENTREFLKGETDKLQLTDLPLQGLAAYWKTRWLEGRAERRPEYRQFKKAQIRDTIQSRYLPRPSE